MATAYYTFKREMFPGMWVSGKMTSVEGVITETTENFKKFRGQKLLHITKWLRKKGFSIYRSPDPNKLGSRV